MTMIMVCLIYVCQNLKYIIFPDEINLYNDKGIQVEHLNIDKRRINWNILNKICQ